MFYQWGVKEPRAFATSSFKGGAWDYQYGKYPVKIYNGKSELIYQEDAGRDNSSKTPVGGVIIPNRLASSMMETIKKPNVFYGNWSAVISQSRHSKELWDYYWTSYSKGTDGKGSPGNYPSWHNSYLDGYIALRSKSIYDPCPYGYRTFTNGTYNDFKIDYSVGWFSYNGGVQWRDVWFVQQGLKTYSFSYVGGYTWCSSSTNASLSSHYTMQFSDKINCLNRDNQGQSSGLTVRCIEDATGELKLS